jgi:hypothetical protein
LRRPQTARCRFWYRSRRFPESRVDGHFGRGVEPKHAERSPRRSSRRRRRARWVGICPGARASFDVVINAQGEFADAYLIDGSTPPKRVVFIDPDPPTPNDPRSRPRVGRHCERQALLLSEGFRPKGGFVMADDTYREACLDTATPQARCDITNPHDPNYVGKDATAGPSSRRAASGTSG